MGTGFLAGIESIRKTLGSAARRKGLIDRTGAAQNFVITGGSSSIRQFEKPCREAGAAARVLLCQAAAARWDTDWEQCET